ncbi:hypothetical protein Y032_0278g1160 [Ancylostoma ceylanicum]|nr:hypothetical protein Y032_0278g1160 [Ancylostoma ceylanicum]
MLHQHPLPTVEDVFNTLNGGEFFSQIDLADAYLQIEVDDASKELLTINTHRGLFRYNRLTFGVKSAPGIFQQIIDSMIAGLNGVAAYLDDIIVTGRNMEEHRQNLEALFERIHTYGFRVRMEKCTFMMSEIRTNGITHVRSPPFHPQSNGQAERFVDTFKRALEKLKDSGTTSEALQKFLQTYRRTPCSASPGGRSPAENFLGRQLRTPLTMLTMPKSAVKGRNRKMESQFNLHNKARPKKFEPDDAVWVRNFGRGGASTNGIIHVRSPPFHPQSNGQAERFVDTFKRALEKLKDSGTTSDPLQKFLQTYRRTPCSASPGGRSPAENFLGRQLRTPLTMLTMPQSAVKGRNRKMESQFNLHNNARPKKFEPGDAVWVRNFGRGGARWTPGRALARHGHATYDVLIDGRVHRRHSNQMRPNAPENSEKTLLDLFDLPILPAQTPTNTTPASTDTQTQDTTLVSSHR